ncbi:hypothetical protein pb186bvf_013247 [Paramecium bursaria]
MDSLQELFSQLIQFTDGLQDKINQIKEKNQVEFIVAYNNHMIKIKRDLQELKQKSEDQERVLQQNEKALENEKKLAWFREESIQLYMKLEQKNKENAELRFKIQELQQDKEFLEQQTKALMRRNRLLESNEPIVEQKVIQDMTFCTNTFQIPSNIQFIIREKSLRKSTDHKMEHSITLSSTHLNIVKDMLNQKLSDQDTNLVVDDILNYIQKIEGGYIQKQRNMQQKISSLLQSQTRSNVIRSELENFFLECVESVRRDIMKRKSINHVKQMQQYVEQLSNFQVFLKEDKQKVLELLLSHEKLLVYLYQKIFPNHFNLVLQQAKDQTDINTVANQLERKQSPEIEKRDLSITHRELRSLSHRQQLQAN